MTKTKTRKLAKAVKNSNMDISTSGFHTPIQTDLLISTGSTLLDLAISGGRVRGGGVPGGILWEIFGGSGAGKTAVLVETAVSAQSKGGDLIFLDPEARLDHEYAKIYGLDIKEMNYERPDTVTEMMELVDKWEPENKEVVSVIAADSLAALSTKLELEKGDKMGMRRAKEFSEGLRKTARKIANGNRLLICSNQIRQGDYGETTPGGEAVKFYSSLRTKIKQKSKIEKKVKVPTSEDKKKEVSRIIGIESEVTVIKNSIDNPYRTAPVYIIFGFGIDDVRANLQWLKDTTQNTVYKAVDKEYQSMAAAIKHIEEDNLEKDLREEVIDLWIEVEKHFKSERKKKVRF